MYDTLEKKSGVIKNINKEKSRENTNTKLNLDVKNVVDNRLSPNCNMLGNAVQMKPIVASKLNVAHSPVQRERYQKSTPEGYIYTKHGTARANERGFNSEKIDNIISGYPGVKELYNRKWTWSYCDYKGNTVILDGGALFIITVYGHFENGNNGHYVG